MLIARRHSLALIATASGPSPVDARHTSAVRHAEPAAVRLAWWRDDPHPATQTAVEPLTDL
jgi:hypothetical protein